jgi:hypothetical protein
VRRLDGLYHIVSCRHDSRRAEGDIAENLSMKSARGLNNDAIGDL